VNPHPTAPVDEDAITLTELATMACHWVAMRWDLAPIGLHYPLVHDDVPVIDKQKAER
jgi:hypothetical protein